MATAATRQDWLRAGEALSAVLLTAVSRGLAVAPITDVLEVEHPRELVTAYCVPGGIPYALVRCGYRGATARHWPRRPAAIRRRGHPVDGGVMADDRHLCRRELSSRPRSPLRLAAPSLHNSQPWRFAMRGDTVQVRADPRRTLAVADPTGWALRLSCGAATYNLCLAFAVSGTPVEVEWLPDVDRPRPHGGAHGPARLGLRLRLRSGCSVPFRSGAAIVCRFGTTPCRLRREWP